MKKTLFAAAASSLIALAPSADAQWVVIDPTNLAQNLLTAAHTLEQVNNQILQLQNEAQMLMNEARNLTSLDFNALADLRATLSATNQLSTRTRPSPSPRTRPRHRSGTSASVVRACRRRTGG